jgi:hypothetical protein
MVEHAAVNRVVEGSSPSSGAINARENEEFSEPRTDSAQLSAVSPRKGKFPHPGRFRTLAGVIYGKSESYPFYRMAVRVAGKRVVRSFQTFTDAKTEAEAKLRDAAKGNQSAGLSAKESADALAVRECIPASVAGAWARLVNDLLKTFRFASTRATIEPTADAREAMKTHFNSIVERRLADLRDVNSFAGRWAAHRAGAPRPLA